MTAHPVHDRKQAILRALHDPQLEPGELRARFDAAARSGDAPGRLVLACALVLCLGIADADYTGFMAAIDAILADIVARSAVTDSLEASVVAAGEFVARMFGNLADPELPALADALLASLSASELDVSMRCASALAVLSYADEQLDVERIRWAELSMRVPLADPALNPRLADEWLVLLVRAFHVTRQLGHADELRRRRADSKAALSTAGTLKFALLDARLAISEGRLPAGQLALQSVESLLDAGAPGLAARWHFQASRLAQLENRLDDALTHARLSLSLHLQASVPERWIGVVVMQEGQVQVARGNPFAAVPFFERAGRSGSGVQADYCWCLAHLARALGHADAGADVVGDGAARAELAAGFALIRRLQWIDFFRANIAAAARLCALALEAGIDTGFVRELIAKRGFTTERRDLAAWPWPIRVRTLGRFEIEVDGSVLALRGKGARKPLELLQFIIASGGSDIATASVTFALWPELDGDKAKAAFNVALHRLRKLLGRDAAIELELGRLGIGTRSMWVDCLAFEWLADQAAAPLDDTSARLAERAQALYTGPWRRDDNAPWQTVYHARLESKFRRIVRALVAYWTARNLPGPARDLLERALELEPAAEDLTRELMALLGAQGEAATALAAFERCRAALAATFGTHPAEATLELAAQLRAPPRRRPS